jgi:threonine-phosphate decarboxylase
VKRPHGGASDPSILDFSANVNPLGVPDGVRAVLADGAGLVERYSTSDAREFIRAAARHHGIPEECILAGNGASDLIYLVARLFAGVAGRVVVPAFTEYEDACEAMGIRLSGENPVVSFVGNPSSPEGRLRGRGEVLALSGTIVLDEAFMDFAGEAESLLTRAACDARLIVLRTLTKFYAIPGLRLGYLVAVPDVVARLKRLQAPWSVNALAEAAGVAALREGEYGSFTRRFIEERRAELSRGLREVGLEPHASVTNYILCRVHDGATLCRELLKRGIAARNCDSFTGMEPNRYVRFAVRKRSDNERLLATLKEICQQCPA